MLEYIRRLYKKLCKAPEEQKETDESVKKFVESALMQICSGVDSARVQLENKEIPKEEGVKKERVSNSFTGVINLITDEEAKEYKYPKQFIEFDILLSSTKEGSAKIGFSMSSLDAGGDRKSSQGNQSRVKFNVPVTFPVTILETEKSKE